MKKYTEMTPEEIKSCFRAAHNGDKKARDFLITENIPLVKYIVRHCFGAYKSDMADIIQVGYIGLIKAVDQYDETRGVPFSSYAYPKIWSAIKRSIWQDTTITVSEAAYIAVEQRLRMIKELSDELGRAPTQQEIDDRLGKATEIQKDAMHALMKARAIDERIDDDGSDDFGRLDIFLDKNDHTENTELKAAVESALQKLTEKERHVIEQRILCERTLREIGAELGISGERVRQIQNKAEAKLRVHLKSLSK